MSSRISYIRGKNISSKNNEVSLRLKKIRESTGMSQASFAQLFDLPQSTYAKYERGASISDSVLMGLALKGYDLNWLLTGISNNKSSQNSNNENYQSHVLIPVIASRVSAGQGEEWRDEDFLEGEMLPITKELIKGYDLKRIFSARVKGDSMIDAKIYDGDYVFAVKGEIGGDGIYILSVDGEVLIKRLEYDVFTHKVNVISENPSYPMRTVDEDRIVILGKVIGWLHHHPF